MSKLCERHDGYAYQKINGGHVKEVPKMKVFWFHYNKPASVKAGKPQITLHYNRQCLIVDNVVCLVPTSGKLRNQQPRFVITGRASSIKIALDNIAHIA